jgi:50S ribosomal protein L16 3-hydroxylase
LSIRTERYRDPDLVPAKDANEIDAASMQRVLEALNILRMNDADRLGDWFGRFITLYRNAGEAVPCTIPPRIEIEWALQQGARLQRHPWTRMAWRKSGRSARLYVAGQDMSLPARDARRLAAAPAIDGATYLSLSQAGRDAVIELLGAGHYQLPDDDQQETGEVPEESP